MTLAYQVSCVSAGAGHYLLAEVYTAREDWGRPEDATGFYPMVSAPWIRGDWMDFLISFLRVGRWISSSLLM